MLGRISFFALLIFISSSVLAQYDHPRKKQSAAGSRDGRWETSVILAYQTGVDNSYENGSAIDVDSAMGWGIGVGWNWTDKLNLSYRYQSTNPDYTAVVVPEDPDAEPVTIAHDLSKKTHQFNVTYNFSGKAFTPFIVAGVGWSKLESNVPSGLSVGCWWDPWWGYICFEDWETYETSQFSYNLGAGVRWDINNFVFTKATYMREFLDVKNGSVDFDTAILELGLMF
jgi:opacity protein-like surface antigen